VGGQAEVHQALPQDAQVHLAVPVIQTLGGEDARVPEEDHDRYRG